LLRLDYKQQGKVFDQFLKKEHQFGAFLIYGELEHGQDWLLNRFLYRLSRRLAERTPRGHIGKVYKLDFASKVRKRDVDTLWRELAVEIGLRSSRNPPSPKILIDATQALLKTQTVVFILRNPVWIGEGCIKQFLDSFWSPLTTKNETYTSSSSHYCLLFLIDNDDCIDKWITAQCDETLQPVV